MNEDDLRAVTIGELQPLAGNIELADDDPAWPAMYARGGADPRGADRLLLLEHSDGLGSATPSRPRYRISHGRQVHRGDPIRTLG